MATVGIMVAGWGTGVRAADGPGLLPGGVAGAAGAAPRALDEAARVRVRAMAAYWAGLVREREGDEAGAWARYEEALKLDPGHWRLAVRVAEREVASGQADRALARLEAAVAARPSLPEPLLVLSEFCRRHHETRVGWKERAVAAADLAVERFPDRAEVHAHLIGLHLRLGGRAEAVAALERAVARSEADPRYWLGLAGAAMSVWPTSESATREKVLGLYRRARSLAPEDPGVTGALADFLARHREMGEASQLYREMVERRPDDLQAREKLARTLALTDRREEAIDAWQAVLRIDPQHETAHRALARHFGQAGDLAASVRHRAEALRWGREETLGEAMRLAEDMLRAGLGREALPVLERAEFQAPRSPHPPYLAALAHQAAGDLPRALAAFARAEAAALADPEAGGPFLHEGFYYEWAVAAAAAGQAAVAEAKFREAIARVPAAAPELAAKSYNGLAYLWLEAGERVDEAGPLIDRALKLDPDNEAYLDTRGWYLFRKGEYRQALELFEKAEASLARPVAEMADHRAQALWALGRRAEAVAVLEKATTWSDATEAMKSRLAGWRADPLLRP